MLVLTPLQYRMHIINTNVQPHETTDDVPDDLDGLKVAKKMMVIFSRLTDRGCRRFNESRGIRVLGPLGFMSDVLAE